MPKKSCSKISLKILSTPFQKNSEINIYICEQFAKYMKEESWANKRNVSVQTFVNIFVFLVFIIPSENHILNLIGLLA
jgi:hypothetical protein